MDALTSWTSPWAGLSAVVVGLGKTGFAVLDTLVELGVSVTVLARDADPDVVNIAQVLGATVVVDAGDHIRLAAVHELEPDFAVVSPGIDPGEPVVVALQNRGVVVWSDVDFAWRVRDKYDSVADWVVLTGDAHSDEVAGLATRILAADNQVVAAAGYRLVPLLDVLRDPTPHSTIIVVASEQSLHWWGTYPESTRSPLVSIALDEDFSESAGVIFDGTTLACVYRRGVGPSEKFVERAEVVEGARAIGVGLDAPGMSDVGLVEGILCDRAFLSDRKNQALEISTVEELSEAGWELPDALPSVLGAVAIARARDVSPALIAGVLTLP